MHNTYLYLSFVVFHDRNEDHRWQSIAILRQTVIDLQSRHAIDAITRLRTRYLDLETSQESPIDGFGKQNSRSHSELACIVDRLGTAHVEKESKWTGKARRNDIPTAEFGR